MGDCQVSSNNVTVQCQCYDGWRHEYGIGPILHNCSLHIGAATVWVAIAIVGHLYLLVLAFIASRVNKKGGIARRVELYNLGIFVVLILYQILLLATRFNEDIDLIWNEAIMVPFLISWAIQNVGMFLFFLLRKAAVSVEDKNYAIKFQRRERRAATGILIVNLVLGFVAYAHRDVGRKLNFYCSLIIGGGAVALFHLLVVARNVLHRFKQTIQKAIESEGISGRERKKYQALKRRLDRGGGRVKLTLTLIVIILVCCAVLLGTDRPLPFCWVTVLVVYSKLYLFTNNLLNTKKGFAHSLVNTAIVLPMLSFGQIHILNKRGYGLMRMKTGKVIPNPEQT
jgi:hypothetical protein